MTSTPEAERARRTDFLRRAPVLALLPEAELHRLLDDGRPEAFAAGTELIRAGSVTDSAYLVVDGAVDVIRPAETVRLEAPALVGEIAALTGIPRTATVRASRDGKAIVLERDRFLRAVRRSPAAGQALSELVADRICAPGSIRRVGRFAIEAIVGKGGSGRVLSARHPLLDIPVALKMLSHALALLPDGPQSFIREASLLARLDHPNIVRVLDAFEAHDTLFIVMPWLDGSTLRELIDEGTPPEPELVLQIAADTLDALAAVHAIGLVHRDIKPSNLFLRRDGRVVVIDFGISCSEGARPGAVTLLGSPAYCSPEQILGRPIDGRSDVYSLACTLYELVHGRPPFAADDVDAAIDAHLRGTVRWDVPPRVKMGDGFAEWLWRCLSRTRAARPTAAEALAGLARLVAKS